MGNDEIPVHKDVADAALLEQSSDKRTPRLHITAERHGHLRREAKFPQRERHFGDRDATAPQVVVKPRKKQANRTH